MTVSSRLDREILRVVERDNCSGCGTCALLDSGIAMTMAADGFLRPGRVGTSHATRGAVREFRRSCPGVRVAAQRPSEAVRHPTMGPVIQAWEAYATDPAVRRQGSSGGALTALAGWLVETGRVPAMAGAAAAAEQPRTTVSVTITSRAEALTASGSRYAPVPSAANPALLAGAGLVGKPCEVSAVRALTSQRRATGDAPATEPVLLSFFCAGTPSQHATDRLLADLGVAPETSLRDLWYRGRGWPGSFTVIASDGSVAQTSYEESWGKALGPSVQWRCKICPDGVGESADISAADFWRSDAQGYPVFEEGEGVSALLARTQRGAALVEEAARAGVLTLSPLDIDELAGVQPLQTSRRETLLGRLAGARMAGAHTPSYRGFGLLRLAVPRLRLIVRTARGTHRRVKAARR